MRGDGSPYFVANPGDDCPACNLSCPFATLLSGMMVLPPGDRCGLLLLETDSYGTLLKLGSALLLSKSKWSAEGFGKVSALDCFGKSSFSGSVVRPDASKR